MALRDTLRRAAGLLVELPPEEAASKPGASAAELEELLAELDSGSSSSGRGKTKTVEQIVTDTEGPNLDEIEAKAAATARGEPFTTVSPRSPAGPDSPNNPSVLHNAMIHPLLPCALRGAIWYQGESNAGRAAEYEALFTAMIRGWRSDWQVKDFPFLIVQLAPYQAIQAEPAESGWAALREAQAQLTTDLPNVGLAVITDVGDERDIHPTKKKPVGERLALAARKIAYGERIVASGPSLRSARVETSSDSFCPDSAAARRAARSRWTPAGTSRLGYSSWITSG